MNIYEMYLRSRPIDRNECKYCKFREGCHDYGTVCFKYKYHWNNDYVQINGVTEQLYLTLGVCGENH